MQAVMWVVSSSGSRLVVARILRALIPGGRERSDGYIFPAGARAGSGSDLVFAEVIDLGRACVCVVQREKDDAARAAIIVVGRRLAT